MLLLLFQRTDPAPNYKFPVGDLRIVFGEEAAIARMLHALSASLLALFLSLIHSLTEARARARMRVL